MKLLNAEVDNLALSGQVEPLDKYRKNDASTTKYKDLTGYHIILGEPLSPILPSAFLISSEQFNERGLSNMFFKRSSFVLRESLEVPLVWDADARMRGTKNLLLTGDSWTTQAGIPTIEAIILEDKYDEHQVKVLAAGVQTSHQYPTKTNTNVLLEVPSNAQYVINGIHYSCYNDELVEPNTNGVYLSIAKLLEGYLKPTTA